MDLAKIYRASKWISRIMWAIALYALFIGFGWSWLNIVGYCWIGFAAIVAVSAAIGVFYWIKRMGRPLELPRMKVVN